MTTISQTLLNYYKIKTLNEEKLISENDSSL